MSEREVAVLENRGLVGEAMKGIRLPERSAIDYDDLRQEGIIALIQAFDRWSPDMGVARSTYAFPRIQRRIRWAASLEWRSQGRWCKVISCEELECPVEAWACDPGAEEEFGKIVLGAMMAATLDEREQEVVKRYLGLAGYLPRSQGEIGEALGISQTRVNQLYQRAIAKLREACGVGG